jgi:cytochrome P450
MANAHSNGGTLPVTAGSFLEFPSDPLLCMRRLYRAHGPLAALEDQGQQLVFAFGPEYCKRVLSDAKTFHAQFFAIRGSRNSAQRRLTSGLLSMNGEEHKRQRRFILEAFQKPCLDSYYPVLVELAKQLADEWQPGQSRNVFRDMTRYMLRVTSTLLFGLDRSELAYEIGESIGRWVSMNHQVGMGAFIANQEATTSYGDLLTLAEELEAKIRTMIDYRRASPPGNDVLSALLGARDEAGTMLTEAELIGQTALLFGAAHLTTANTLTWTLFLLAQHPEIARELTQELQQELGGEVPDLDLLDRLPLLDGVLKESMRLLPASAYSHRVCAEPVELGPLSLAKGTTVIFSQIITHHLPELFPEPEHFRPERWRTIAPSPYAYFPFAAGPRKCLGAGLALMTLKITLATLLQRHCFCVVPGVAINARVSFTMLNATSGMPMFVLPRSSPFARVPVAGNIHELVNLGTGVQEGAPLFKAA